MIHHASSLSVGGSLVALIGPLMPARRL